MDLIDLYHAHEYSLANNTESTFESENQESDDESEVTKAKVKKPKFVPWEPFKAAPGPDRKGKAPDDIPLLIPYRSINKVEKVNENDAKPVLIDGMKLRKKRSSDHPLVNEKVIRMEKELEEFKKQLDLERKLNGELKTMFLSSLGDDLQIQVEALAEDKIHLGRRLEEYCEKVAMGNEEVEGLKIERDVWKCKFQAQSIRADELNAKVDYLLDLLKRAQVYVKKWSEQSSNETVAYRKPPAQVVEFCNFDLHKLYLRSPCDPRIKQVVRVARFSLFKNRDYEIMSGYSS
ncbi:unnamed protein product [Auanema sp. JU1783]|nr:unnamed protein product [Auanema sp. JU1783]